MTTHEFQIGEIVAVSQSGCGELWRAAKVEKVTPREVTASGVRYNRRSCKRIGHGGSHWAARVSPMTDWHRDRIVETQRFQLQSRVMVRLGEAALPVEQLRKIEAILAEASE